MNWLIQDLKIQIAVLDHIGDSDKISDIEKAIMILKNSNRDDSLTKKVSTLIRMFWDNNTDTSIGISALEITDISAINELDEIIINVTLGRPGLLIGKGGRTIDELKDYLLRMLDKKIEILIFESKLWK